MARSLLRFITCGNVDDGKSTLIGRLLHDGGGLYNDQKLTSLDGEALAQLTDGLEAEREQGITIDVAYRFFATPLRSFIIADVPGHEQYTRNMATGASTADLAVILIDARHGVQTQTRRHSFIVSLLGIKKVIVAVNKMDQVGFSQQRYKAIQQDYLQIAAQLNLSDLHFVPISALHGDNVVNASAQMGWFRGRTLLHYLEQAEIAPPRQQPFRFPVQMVRRLNTATYPDYRAYAGRVVAGAVSVGDTVRVLPSGGISSIAAIDTFDGELDSAEAGQSVLLRLHDELDISRGAMLVQKDQLAQMAQRLRAHLVWLHEDAGVTTRDYILKMGTQTCRVTIEQFRFQIEVNSFAEQACRELPLNGIAVADLHAAQQLVFDRYSVNRDTGSFILIDPVHNHTVAAGMVMQALPDRIEKGQTLFPGSGLQPDQNHNPLKKQKIKGTDPFPDAVISQPLQVSSAQRAAQKSQQPLVVWFTGLSGSGKSTLANALDQALTANGQHCYLLDGDNMRLGLNRDLSFRDSDRHENMRRIGEVAKLMLDAGLVVLCAFVSPYRDDREQIKRLVGAERFIEVHVNTPLDVCEARDTKGLYARARQGELNHFTGISAPYEEPLDPALRLNTDTNSNAVDELLDLVTERCKALGDTHA